MAALKTYVLLDHTRPTAPIYLRVNSQQRMRLDTRPIDHAYLKYTFLDPVDQKNKTFRLKLSCNELDQAVQIKEHNIPANEKFTNSERNAVRFKNGVLTTSNPTVQRFLEASPQFDGFKGERPEDIRMPLYTVHDKYAEITSDNLMFKKRLRAANKIDALESVSAAQSLLIRLNGSSFKTPDTLEECQNLLANFLDDADEPMLDGLLKEELNEDEKVVIIIGKAINKGIISFNEVVDHVVRKTTDGRTLKVKEISSEYDLDTRKRYFMEFLTSPKGELLLNEITTAVNESEGIPAAKEEVGETKVKESEAENKEESGVADGSDTNEEEVDNTESNEVSEKDGNVPAETENVGSVVEESTGGNQKQKTGTKQNSNNKKR